MAVTTVVSLASRGLGTWHRGHSWVSLYLYHYLGARLTRPG